MNIENRNDACHYLLFDVGKTSYAVTMEYVGYIISALEQFQCCVLPEMPSYVSTVMNIGNKLVPIIELENFAEYKDLEAGRTRTQHLLILILNYCNVPIGLLTDRISLLSGQEEVRIEADPVSQHIVLTINGKNFVLFNVPEFYKEINRD